MSATLRPLIQRLERRLSRSDAQLQLSLRNLYILPTGFGGLWLLATGVLYLLGINTSSNGPLLLAFLCTGLFLLSLFLTQFNLQGLRLETDTPSPGFAGAGVAYPLRLRSRSERHSLRLQFRGQPLLLEPALAAGCNRVEPQWHPEKRGLQRPGRLKLYSKAPMGLFVCWSYWDPPEAQLIYPAPLAGPVLECWISSREAQQQSALQSRDGGSDDFLELSPHRREEGLQRVAWKQVARGRGWLVKRFETDAERQLELALDPQLPMEQGLSHLCARILELQRQQQGFALRLPGGRRVAYGHGKTHTQAALSALALI